MLIIALATLMFLVLLFWRAKRDILEYEVLCLIVYLTAFLFLQEFGALIVVYEVFAVIPFAVRFRLGGKEFVFLMLVALWGLASVPRVGLVSFAEIFFTRYFFLIAVLLLLGCSSNAVVWGTCNVNKAFWEAVVAEALFVGYLLLTNRASADVFVVSHQPLVGNMSICAVLLAARLIHDRSSSGKAVPGSVSIAMRVLFCMAVCVASGIRGYIILVVPMGLYLLYALVGNKRVRIVFALSSVAIAAMFLCAYSAFGEGGVRGLVTDIDTSIGYRENENQFFVEALLAGDVVDALFGHGIGVTGGEVSLYAVHFAAVSPFVELHLLETNTLLNIWELYVLNVGLVGVGAVCVVLYCLIRQVYRNVSDQTFRCMVVLYVAAYAVMLAFRNSVSCGVPEFLILGIVVFATQETQKEELWKFS